MRKLSVPIVNLGGTNCEALLDNYCLAIHALNKAVVDLADCAPHPRDFPAGFVIVRGARAFHPTEGHNRFEVAQAQHLSRVRKIESVIKDLNAIQLLIADQERAR